MSGGVVPFPYQQALTTPEVALRAALERGLSTVLIIGYTEQGTIYIRSSADVSRKDALWLAEQARMSALGVGPYAEDYE